MTDFLHLTVRQATAEDQPFLLRLFAVDRAQEFSALGLPQPQMDQFLALQFHARQHGYASAAPDAVDSILCLEDGTAIGRHLVEYRSDSLRTIDLAIMPKWRNRRIGGWALHQVQLEAVRLSLPYRLSVRNTNPARRLYARQGFSVIAQNDLDVQLDSEMEWRLSSNPGDLPREEVIDRIALFLRGLGLTVEFGPVPSNNFLPGIHLIPNGLRIQSGRLLHPGDLLHEAGHLAVMPPEARLSVHPEPTDGGEELAATAWSYAAALHLGIPVTQVIHDNGYRRSAAIIREVLATGEGFGIPLLGWMGLTQPGLYPNMLCWIRESVPGSMPAPAEEPQLVGVNA